MNTRFEFVSQHGLRLWVCANGKLEKLFWAYAASSFMRQVLVIFRIHRPSALVLVSETIRSNALQIQNFFS